MKRNKILATTAACLLLAGVLAVPALAHGGCRRSSGATPYPVCTVEDCTETYRHEHDGVTYCAHSAADGHAQCAQLTGTGTGRGTGRGMGRGHCR